MDLRSCSQRVPMKQFCAEFQQLKMNKSDGCEKGNLVWNYDDCVSFWIFENDCFFIYSNSHSLVHLSESVKRPVYVSFDYGDTLYIIH